MPTLSIKKAKDDLKHGNRLAVFSFKSQLGEFNVYLFFISKIQKFYVKSFSFFFFLPHCYVRGEMIKKN